MKMTPEIRNLSIYVHIPFCRAKCSYCDFLSFGGLPEGKQRQYVNALCREIEAYRTISGEYQVQTIFFGGGTPSYVEADLISQIIGKIQEVFDVADNAEITIEGNPDSLINEKLLAYRKAGINRLSIGLQSTNDEMLAQIGRVHNYNQFLAAFRSARQAGFSNINVDLMSGLPGENMDSYLDTLNRVLELSPEHISAYSLIVEEGTPLSRNEEQLALIPDEEEDRKMYAQTCCLLKQSGYERYEISNYARNGFACRHNQVYWTGGEYLGVGLGAASYLMVRSERGNDERIRFHGVEDIEEYIGRFLSCDGMQEDEYTDVYQFYESAGEDMYPEYEGFEHNLLLRFVRDFYRDLYFCKRKDEIEEFMFLGLRLAKGVSRKVFHERFGVAMESIYGAVIAKYVKSGLLVDDVKSQRVYLSDEGIDVSNMVMAEFML